MQATRTLALGALMILAACGGADNGVNGPPPVNGGPSFVSVQAGDHQTAPAGTMVPTAPSVLVLDQNHQPMTGVPVVFTAAAGGGTVTGGNTATNAQGIATVGGWQLGSSAGPNTLQAQAGSVEAFKTVSIGATAIGNPPVRAWTVMVYMAADNNLAVQGIQDIDEMESAGVDPAVQVVVQAEFSPTTLQQYQCDAGCFNRPNFNTFRYAITGQGAATAGPNGPATDIGNRNMTDPAELHDFVQWAKQNYPANHYLLVLWNHGGGYVGLLQDQTTAGSGLMSLEQLRSALTGVGQLDIVDFDMCLMAGYETLVKLNGLAQYAVFSEETEPGEGNPYKGILDGIQATPNATPRAVAGLIVDQYDAFYQGNQASTTLSAYDLGGFATFESALNTLAGSLDANLAGLQPVLSPLVATAQKYSIPELTDIGNLMDSLDAHIADATIHSQIAAVRSQVTGGFRVNSRARNGNGQNASSVSRSTGLNIVLPSGVGQDQLGQTGPRSLAAYQALYPGRPWTTFLTDWLGGQATIAQTDQGNARFETYLVWDSNAPAAGADVDLWVLEPNGNIYAPRLGSVTPDGTFSNDSYTDGTYFEGYLTNRYVQNGTYKFYAFLWQDPADLQPAYDLAYRYDQVSSFSTLYAPNYPKLSLAVSWLDDPAATLQQVEAGAYTDLQYVANLSFGAGGAAPLAARGSVGTQAATAGPQITAPQLATLRRLAKRRRPAAAGAAPAPMMRALRGVAGAIK